jgi:hypothetical protein
MIDQLSIACDVLSMYIKGVFDTLFFFNPSPSFFTRTHFKPLNGVFFFLQKFIYENCLKKSN